MLVEHYSKRTRIVYPIHTDEDWEEAKSKNLVLGYAEQHAGSNSYGPIYSCGIETKEEALKEVQGLLSHEKNLEFYCQSEIDRKDYLIAENPRPDGMDDADYYYFLTEKLPNWASIAPLYVTTEGWYNCGSGDKQEYSWTGYTYDGTTTQLIAYERTED